MSCFRFGPWGAPFVQKKRVGVLSLMMLVPAVASAATGTPGADGSGNDGLRGEIGGEGGAAFVNGDASLSIGAGVVHAGGVGGEGRSLNRSSDGVETAAFDLDGTAPLAGQKGITAGDAFSITVDGVTENIVIDGGDTLIDLADKINADFSSYQISAYGTARGGADYLVIAQGYDLFNIELNNSISTPLTALGLDGVLARPFDHGGHGGAGGHGVVRQGADRITNNAGGLYGGVGGEGGYSDYYAAGEGGRGGDGGDAFRDTDGGGTLTNAFNGYIQGGDGGTGGAGTSYQYPALGGAGGDGGSGVRMEGGTLVNRGDILGGTGGLGERGADGGAAGDAVWIENAVSVRQLEGGLYGGWGGDSAGSGGDGSDGGVGLRLTGSAGSVEILGGEVVGGRGGDGAQSGDGGAGIVMAGGDLLIANGAEVEGGDSGFVGFGMVAEGGVGVRGTDLDVTLGGTVQGGTRSDGSNRVAAIHFTGGDNRLTLLDGFEQRGGVLADGGSDVLALGGADDGAFDLNDIGTAFQGFDGFAKRGASTWTLSGSGTQNWLIEGGTLAGDTGALQGDVVNQGVLRFDQNTDGAYNGTVSGAGVLEKTGTGVLTLSGINSHSGGTLVRGGGVSVATQAALGSAALGLDGGALIVTGTGFTDTARQLQLGAGGGALDVAEAGHTLTWNGALLGTGAFEKTGAGALLLTGANSFSGGLTVSGGTLTGAVASLGGGDIVNNATLVIDQATDAVFAGRLGGTGDMRKTGNGWLVLASDGAGFTGDTLVEQGGLSVNADWSTSAFTVASGGNLGGDGRVGDTVIASGATLAAGNSIGTLTVAGDLTLASGSRLAVEVDPAGHDSDKIEVTGQASLAGSVMHVGNNGHYRPLSEYTFLSADGGILGQFDAVSSGYAFLNPELLYGSNDVTLRLLRNDVAFASLAETENQHSVAAGVETLNSGDAAYRTVLTANPADVTGLFSQLSGDSLLAGLSTGIQAQQGFSDTLRQRGGALGGGSRAGLDRRLSLGLQSLAAPADPAASTVAPAQLTPDRARGEPAAGAGGVWVQSGAVRFEEDNDPATGNAAYTFRGRQVALGLDHRWENWMLGAAVGRTDGEIDYRHRDAQADLSAWFTGLYGRWQGNGPWYLRGDLSYGRGEVDQTRFLSGVAANTEIDHTTWRAGLESGLELSEGPVTLRPYARVAWNRLARDDFNESGAGSLGLVVDDTVFRLGEAALGLDGARDFSLLGRPARVLAGVALEHGFGDRRAQQDAAFVGTTNTFRVYGADRNRAQLAAHLGGEIHLTPDFSLWAGYRGRFGGDSQTQGGLVSANLAW